MIRKNVFALFISVYIKDNKKIYKRKNLRTKRKICTFYFDFLFYELFTGYTIYIQSRDKLYLL